nr:hypothetical protein Hi04_10k_c2089_00066 [uncultured bacterium]
MSTQLKVIVSGSLRDALALAANSHPATANVVDLAAFPATDFGNLRLAREMARHVDALVLEMEYAAAEDNSKFIRLLHSAGCDGKVTITVLPAPRSEFDFTQEEIDSVVLTAERRQEHLEAGSQSVVELMTSLHQVLAERVTLVHLDYTVQQRGEAARHLERFEPTAPDALLCLSAACVALDTSICELVWRLGMPMA